MSGAKKSDVDSSNMTEYGHFRRCSGVHIGFTHFQNRYKLTDVEHKLCLSGGPSLNDFSNRGGSSGLVDYGPEDNEMGLAMGLGAYGDASNEAIANNQNPKIINIDNSIIFI